MADDYSNSSSSGGLLGGDWSGAKNVLLPLLAGLVEFGGARGGRPGAGMALLGNLQDMEDRDRKNKAQALLGQATTLMTGKPAETKTYADPNGGEPTTINWNAQKPNMEAGLALLGSNPLTAGKALEMLPEMEKLKKTQRLNDFMMSRLGGGTPGLLGQPPAGGGAGGATPPTGAVPAGGAAAVAPAATARNGSFPFSFNDVVTLKALGGPDLTNDFKLAGEGFKREPGAAYIDPMTGRQTYMPKLGEGQIIDQSGRVSLAPGATESNAAYQGAGTAAQERARASYDLVTTYDKGSTQPRQTSRLDVLSGGGQSNGAAPAGGYGAPDPGNVTYGNDVAKAAADQYNGLQSAGMKAQSQIAKYQQIGALLDGFDGGKFSPTGVDLARSAKSLGFNIDPKLANKEAALSLANEMALSLRDPSQGGGMPGALSDSDRNFLTQSVPGLTQSSEGRKKMVDMAVTMQQRNSDVAGMARKWQQRYGRLDAVNPATGKSFFDNLSDWSTRNPLFGQ